MSSTSESKSKRHWTAAEKAKLVRRHLRDGIPVATIADENGTAPSMVHGWVRAVLDGADQVLSDKREREGQRADRQLAVKDDRIRHLEEVAAELSMEVLQLKKGLIRRICGSPAAQAVLQAGEIARFPA
ncbi:MAG: transposase, partial [Planctomycetes bacterium]|nr:transposase [Planctomycetota bacterium]